MSTTLLPCPFCGGTPDLQDHGSAWGVHCKCRASVIGERGDQEKTHGRKYWDGIKQSAIDAWNRRMDKGPA